MRLGDEDDQEEGRERVVAHKAPRVWPPSGCSVVGEANDREGDEAGHAERARARVGRGSVCAGRFGTSCGITGWDAEGSETTTKFLPEQGFFGMELAGLEPATSWVRYRVREPNRGDLSSQGCSEFS
jgi:hypothetical protein